MAFTVGELRSYIDLDDSGFNRKVDAAGKRFGGLGSFVTSTGAKVASGLAAFGVAKWLAGSIDVAHQYETTLARLKAAVQDTGGVWDPYAKQMAKVVDAESQLSAYSGGDLRSALADLTTTTGDSQKGLDLLGLSADLARGKHMDLETAAKLVGKVAMGNTAMLARYGIVLDKGATATEALAMLQQRFAGQAKAYGDSSAGAQDKLSNALKGLQRTVGTAAVPSLTILAGITVKALNLFQKLPGPVRTAVIALGALAAAGALLAPWAGAIKAVLGLRFGVMALYGILRNGMPFYAAKTKLMGMVGATGAETGALKAGIIELGLYAGALAVAAAAIYGIVKAYQAWKSAADQAAQSYTTALSTADKALAAGKITQQQYNQDVAGMNASQYQSPQGIGGWLSAAFQGMWNSSYGNVLPKFAGGGDFITNGPTPIMTGEAGRERVTVTPLGKGRGDGLTIHNHIHLDGVIVGGRNNMMELAKQLQQPLGRLIMRQVRGAGTSA